MVGRRTTRARRRVACALLPLTLAACTSGTDEADPSTRPAGSASGQSPSPTSAPTDTHTAIVPALRNARVTSAERYLSGNARAYDWRSFDPLSETGLFTFPRSSYGSFGGLAVVGRTGRLATLTCATDLPCTAEDRGYGDFPLAATLGPGAHEVTVASGDHTAQVLGFDGKVRRTLDLGAITTGRARVWGLRWSADDSRLAVVTNQLAGAARFGEGVSRVWLVNREGGDAQLAYSLAHGDAQLPKQNAAGFDGRGAVWVESDWGWSPDGQTLLLDVLRGTNSSDVVLLHLQPDGAVDPVVAEILYHSGRHFDWAGNVAWSPDGNWIAVRSWGITEISAEDGSVVARHPYNGGWLIWPARKG